MKTLAFSYLGQGTQGISNIFRFCEQKHLNLFVFEDIAMQYLPWFFFGCGTHKGLNDFFSLKFSKPRRPFFYTSKYGIWGFFGKKSNFSIHGFLRYLTPNMALQKIILTSFFFSFFSSSSRSRAMRSPHYNSSKIFSNRNEILQTCLGVNVVFPGTFWVHSVQGFRS